MRELREETGLELTCERTELGTEEWIVFVAEAPAVAEVVLDEEHDRYLWLPARDAAAKCLPRNVRATLLAAERVVAER